MAVARLRRRGIESIVAPSSAGPMRPATAWERSQDAPDGYPWDDLEALPVWRPIGSWQDPGRKTGSAGDELHDLGGAAPGQGHARPTVPVAGHHRPAAEHRAVQPHGR